MSTRPIKALGEIALRVNDLDRMQEFYTSILGLELMQRFQEAAFSKSQKDMVGTLKSWRSSTGRIDPIIRA